MLIMYQSHCRILKKKGNERKWEVKQYVHKWINSLLVCSHWSRWQLLLLLLLGHFSHAQLFTTPWTAAYQAPPPMGFSRQEHWSRVPLPSPISISAAAAKSLQSCPTLCDPMECSLPGSSIHGIFQARVLEWVAIAFSKMTTKYL